MGKLKIALRSVKPIVMILFILSLIDIVVYIPLSRIPSIIDGFSELGEIVNKLSYSFISAFIFYFLTQRMTFADDKVKYREYIISVKGSLIDSFTHFFSQMNLFSMASLPSEKITNLEITPVDLHSIIEGFLKFKEVSAFESQDLIINGLINEFRYRYQKYLDKMLEFKEYYERKDVLLVTKLSESQLLDVGKYINDIKDIKLIYLGEEMKKLLDIQEILKELKE